MTDVLHDAALACVLLGLASAAIVLGRAREGRLAVKVLLEFLLAAGLLRLAADPGWRELAAAAAVVAVRRLLSFGLRQGQRPAPRLRRA